MALTEVAQRVHRLGTRFVSFYLVEDGGDLVLVDAGFPSYRRYLDDALRELGRMAADVQAVVLTHAHGDHVGFAEELRREADVPVLVHEGDRELATEGRQPKRERSMLPYLRHLEAWRFLREFGRTGGRRFPHVAHVATFRDGDVLDVPGRPRAIHTPGHTRGHCVLHFPGHGVLFAGDQLCTLNPLTGSRGPQLLPASLAESSAQALESLARFEDVEATLLFGHGDPWEGGVAAAVAEARRRGPT